jgi:hypothetical protein
MAKHKFLGVTMDTKDIETFYLKDPHFNAFVFQQVINDVTSKPNDYTLTVYPVDAAGNVLGGPLTLTHDPAKDIDLDQKKAEFANMKLTKASLDYLYSPGGVVNLKIYPTGCYERPPGTKTGYVAYAVDLATPGLVAKPPVPLNPSPPA